MFWYVIAFVLAAQLPVGIFLGCAMKNGARDCSTVLLHARRR